MNSLAVLQRALFDPVVKFRVGNRTGRIADVVAIHPQHKTDDTARVREGALNMWPLPGQRWTILQTLVEADDAVWTIVVTGEAAEGLEPQDVAGGPASRRRAWAHLHVTIRGAAGDLVLEVADDGRGITGGSGGGGNGLRNIGSSSKFSCGRSSTSLTR